MNASKQTINTSRQTVPAGRYTDKNDKASMLSSYLQSRVGKQSPNKNDRNEKEGQDNLYTTHFGHDFSRMNIFPKLTISKPGDALEQEADSMAERAMQMPADKSSRSLAKLNNPAPSRPVSRSCSGSCMQEDDEIHRAEDSGATEEDKKSAAGKINLPMVYDSRPPDETEDANQNNETEPEQALAAKREPGSVGKENNTKGLSSSINGAIRNGGKPLPNHSRRFMESRFGYDFSSVRIHTDSTANALSRQVQAHAFATGNNIFFSQGQFQPDHYSGQRLLAHELAHVVQQGKTYNNEMHIHRSGNGCLNCKPYCGYNTAADIAKYNCAGLAHRTYDFKSPDQTKAALSKGKAISSSDICDSVGVIKHWLWEYDMHAEDSSGNQGPSKKDFHTVGGPTDGDPFPKESDEVLTKNGRRNVYGPGFGASFKPKAKEQDTTNDALETPKTINGGPLYKVRTNMTESCYCLPCP